MAVLEIQTNDAPVLRQKAAPIREIDADLHPFIEDMFETMYEAEGIGLAAPQVGISKRIIVIDIERHHPEYPRIALINPVITLTVGEELGEEGCLSLPGVRGMVRRSAMVKVEGLLPNGSKIEFDASHLMARVLQHEIDHLNGILFTDLLRPEDQELLEPRPESSEKSGGENEDSLHGNE
jgi:peptide deformylase